MTESEYLKLIDVINDLDTAYYVHNESKIPDATYDGMMRELLKFETENPKLKARNSPSTRVGGYVAKGFTPVPHSTPMLSLDNVFDLEELTAKIVKAEALLGNSQTWVMEPKVDGLSMSLRYSHGELVAAITRGDGVTGEDVFANVRTIRNLPLTIKAGDVLDVATHGIVEVRGEVYISDVDFARVNAERVKSGGKLFANPRNAAAGAVRSLDSKEVRARRLSFIPYHIVNFPLDQQTMLEQLAAWGFKCMPAKVCKSINDLLDELEEFRITRKKIGFPTDGAVIKLDDVEGRGILGTHSKAPKWAWAFKYEPDQVETILKGITIQVGKSGILAPVAELEPVEVAGSVVSRATLHNQNEIDKKDIRIGDTVVISKAGEVIPQIERVVLEKRDPCSVPFKIPQICPSCGTTAARKEVEDGEGAAWVCSNTMECPDQIIGRLQHWCSRDAMDIEDVGPEVARALHDAGIRSPNHLYMAWTPEQLTLLASHGVKGKLLSNLLERRELSKSQGMERILVGLAIPRVGRSLSKKLAKAYPNLREVIKAAMDYTILEKIPDFGKVNLNSFQTWLKSCEQCAVVINLMDFYGLDIKSKTYNAETASGVFSGQTVVFTGTLHQMSRDEAQRLVESKGGKATGSVSKKTSLLVAGDDCGSKLDKAKALGVKVITEEEFIAMLND